MELDLNTLDSLPLAGLSSSREAHYREGSEHGGRCDEKNRAYSE